jgi:hypothetical protein
MSGAYCGLDVKSRDQGLEKQGLVLEWVQGAGLIRDSGLWHPTGMQLSKCLRDWRFEGYVFAYRMGAAGFGGLQEVGA